MIHARTFAAACLLAAGATSIAGAPSASAAGHAGAGPAHAVAAANTAATPPTPPMAKVTELMAKPLADYPGKEAVLIQVEYPPGAADPVHRHDAHAFVYVLEGSIVMGLQGGQAVTLTAGQTFYEGPDDVHTIGHNASATAPARFVVLLLKNKDAPILTPIQ